MKIVDVYLSSVVLNSGTSEKKTNMAIHFCLESHTPAIFLECMVQISRNCVGFRNISYWSNSPGYLECGSYYKSLIEEFIRWTDEFEKMMTDS